MLPMLVNIARMRVEERISGVLVRLMLILTGLIPGALGIFVLLGDVRRGVIRVEVVVGGVLGLVRGELEVSGMDDWGWGGWGWIG